MGTRSLTMTTPQVSPLFRRIFFLFGKVGLLVFLTMAAGWAYGYALLSSDTFPENINRLAVVIMSSVVAGLLARLLYGPKGLFAAAVGAALSVVASLLDLGNLSGGLIGIVLPRPWTNPLPVSTLWQLMPVPIVLFLALAAWRNPRPARPVGLPAEKPSAIPAKKAADPQPKPARKKARRKAFSLQKQIFKPLRTFYRKTSKKLARLFFRAKTDTGRAVRRAAASLPKPKSAAPAPLPVVKFHRSARAQAASAAVLTPLRRQPKAVHSPIHLVGREEHRCPYCLGIVSPRDPEGVVICPICHTYHHKKCWDVTGSCQVPHIHP